MRTRRPYGRCDGGCHACGAIGAGGCSRNPCPRAALLAFGAEARAGTGWGDAPHERLQALAVVHVRTGDTQGQRQFVPVTDQMDLRSQLAAIGRIRSRQWPPFAALTLTESIAHRDQSSSPRAASSGSEACRWSNGSRRTRVPCSTGGVNGRPIVPLLSSSVTAQKAGCTSTIADAIDTAGPHSRTHAAALQSTSRRTEHRTRIRLPVFRTHNTSPARSIVSPSPTGRPRAGRAALPVVQRRRCLAQLARTSSRSTSDRPTETAREADSDPCGAPLLSGAQVEEAGRPPGLQLRHTVVRLAVSDADGGQVLEEREPRRWVCQSNGVTRVVGVTDGLRRDGRRR